MSKYTETEGHELDWFSLVMGVFVTLAAVAAMSKGWSTEALPWLNLRYAMPIALLLLGALGLFRSLRRKNEEDLISTTPNDMDAG